jgi:hypothetical protein
MHVCGAAALACHRFRSRTTSFQSDGAAQESNLPSVGLPRLTGFEALLRTVHLRIETGFRPPLQSF